MKAFNSGIYALIPSSREIVGSKPRLTYELSILT